MCITSHFIDSDWNLHKRILIFFLIPNYKGETIGKKIEACMLGLGIRSIFTITVDNVSSNDRFWITWRGELVIRMAPY
jgi:hypothetical protein